MKIHGKKWIDCVLVCINVSVRVSKGSKQGKLKIRMSYSLWDNSNKWNIFIEG